MSNSGTPLFYHTYILKYYHIEDMKYTKETLMEESDTQQGMLIGVHLLIANELAEANKLKRVELEYILAKDGIVIEE